MTVNAQKWVEKNCHRDIISLDISNKKLKGPLRFEGFNKLKYLDCYNNDLTSLDVSDCTNLVSIRANYNRIHKIDLPRNDKGLEYLNLLDNNFTDQDLRCFSRFVNLKDLHIGNTGTETDREENIYNRFHGSLEPLKTLINLESLSINNTDINSGLEYLPSSVEILRCSAKERKVKKICEDLSIFAMDDNDVFAGRYNLKAWKKNWILSTKLEKEKDDFHYQLEELNKKLSENEYLNTQQTKLEKKRGEVLVKQEELKSKKIQLEQDIENLQQKVKDLNTKVEQTEIIYQQKKRELDEKLKSLNSFTAEKLMEKERLHKEANDLKEDLAIKRKVKEKLDKKLQKNTEELENKKKEIVNLQHQFDANELIMSDIKMEKEELLRLKRELNNKVYKGKSSTADLRKRMDDLEKQIRLKKNELKKPLLENLQIQERLDGARENVQTLEDEKAYLKTVLKIHGENMQYSKDLIFDLETQLKEKEDLINELQRKNQQQIDYLEIQLNEKEYLINELQQNNEQQNIGLEIQLKEKEFLISKIQQTNQQRLGEINCLFSKIQTKENELNKLSNDFISESELGRAGKDLLKKLLKEQDKFIRFNDYSSEELEKTKKEIIKGHLNSDDVQNLSSLLNKQAEIIRLKLQLESLTTI
ncbi:11579_t:CDS:1 [Funneliformis mosseae]|uniref:11579_t:CDS:1 n=1 Tax=Funneliformis mosseae TaxID=27381 RepID=A0A9N8Z9U1_FUNMO|nr:11579_t:CDS:1 [Funneliformis mosseae]